MLKLISLRRHSHIKLAWCKQALEVRSQVCKGIASRTQFPNFWDETEPGIQDGSHCCNFGTKEMAKKN